MVDTHLAPRLAPTFRWGAAVSAYQTEGAVDADGRGESIWDRFSAVPGAIRAGDTGAIACDSYRRYRDDVALVRALGLDAYRFSVAWPRVVPAGRGRVNDAGLDFYDRLVDELLAAGVEPFPTLYHFDLPQALEDAGGWPARATAEAFADYVAVVADRLGDRVRHWITHNEPWVTAWLGYGSGEHAPGRRSEVEAAAAGHHVLLSHGLATEALRSVAPAAEVGISVDFVAMHPRTSSSADRAASVRLDGERNRWILDAILRGAYPPDLPDRLDAVAPAVRDGDLRTIAAPLDFLGVNYYTRNVVRAGPGRPEVVERPGDERTAQGWEVYPDGLSELLLRLHREYGPPPLYVTESGAAYADRRPDDTVRDVDRIDFLRRHVEAVERAVERGADVRGYFVWSLLDNFEWSFGYSRRFGLVYVDYETLERLPKASYAWYRDLIAAHHAAARSMA